MDLAVAQRRDAIETAVLPLAGGVTSVCLWAKRLDRSPAIGHRRRDHGGGNFFHGQPNGGAEDRLACRRRSFGNA